MKHFYLLFLMIGLFALKMQAQSCEGGTIGSTLGNSFTLCPGQNTVLSNTGASATANYTYIATTTNGTILSVLASNILSVDAANTVSRRVYGVSYSGTLNAPVGSNIATIGASGCTDLSGNYLSVGDPLTLDVAVNCNNGSANVQISVDGGIGNAQNFVFTDQNGAPLSNNPNTTAVTVTDESGCSVTQAVDFDCTSPCDDITFSSGYNCEAGAATLALTASGGSGFYQYTNNGVVVDDGDPVQNGQTLNLVLQDLINGCSVVADPLTVACNPCASLPLPGFTTLCVFGKAYLFIDAPYSYNLHDQNGNPVVNGNAYNAGSTLVVDGTINGNCTLPTLTLIFNQCSACSGLFLSPTYSCNGTTATLEMSAVGGSGSYSYTDGAGNPLTTGAQKSQGDTLSVIVKDNATNCTYQTPLFQINCNNNCNSYFIAYSVSASCYNGKKYFYYISDNDGTVIKDQNNNIIQNGQALSPGNYQLSAYNNSGCIRPLQPFEVSCISCDGSLAATSSYSCNTATGVATLQLAASGGTAPYTFTTQNGNTIQNGATLNDGQQLTITVTDANNCSAMAAPLVVDCEVAVNCSTLQATASYVCNNNGQGVLNVSATGGTAPYTFRNQNNVVVSNGTLLNDGASYVITVIDANGCTFSATSFTVQCAIPCNTLTATASYICVNGVATLNVSASGGNGGYVFKNQGITVVNGALLSDNQFVQITVTDVEGCSFTTNAFTVDCPPPCPAISINASYICQGETPYLQVSASGGAAPYTYYYNGNSVQSGSVLPNNASVGVSVTDANGCTVSAVPFTTVCNDPCDNSALSINASFICNQNGMATLSVSSAGGVGNVVFTTQSGVVVQNGQTLSNGTYLITATDANGCTATATPLLINCTANPCLNTNLQVSANYICNNQGSGVLNITANGGTPPYSFYNALNGTALQNGQTVFNGVTYQVSVTDANGCFASTGSFTVNCPIVPDCSTLNGTATYVCSNGVATLNVAASGGSAPYIFADQNGNVWNNGTVLTNGTTYIFTVTDSNNCTKPAGSFTVNCAIDPCIGNPLTLTAAYTCINGIATLNMAAAGGTAPYTFTNQNGFAFSNGAALVNGATYAFTVTDANNCTYTTAAFTVDCPPPNPCASTNLTATAGYNCEAGVATLNLAANGGLSPYTFTDQLGNEWQNGDVVSHEAAFIFTVTDANGCTETATPFVVDCPFVSVCDNLVVSASYNCINNVATLAVNANGGTPPYSFVNQLGQTLANGAPLSHEAQVIITVTDANDCVKVAPAFTVDCPTGLEDAATAHIALFPNPLHNNDALHIINNGGGMIDVVRVYNAQGKLITQLNTPFSTFASLDTRSWAAGVYMIAFEKEGVVYYSKLIKI